MFMFFTWTKKNTLFLENKNTVKYKFFHAGKLEFLLFPGAFLKQFCFFWAEANALTSDSVKSAIYQVSALNTLGKMSNLGQGQRSNHLL